MPTATAVPTVAAIVAELKSKGKEQTRKIYSRHGMEMDRVLGVSTADMKAIAKSLKGQQGLALDLYKTGIMEAMYLAGMVADGAKMTREQLNEWAEGAAGLQMISEYTVPWVTVENAHARALALEWIESKKENVAASGWSTYSGLVAVLADEALDLAEIEGLMAEVARQIGKAPNRVRYTMNTFVISVGGYVKPLTKKAKAVAREIGEVSVEMVETACKVPLATEYIEKMEAAGKLGKKRKTLRC
jgi:3-methyladenine DNA glycosylase AlkD